MISQVGTPSTNQHCTINPFITPMHPQQPCSTRNLWHSCPMLNQHSPQHILILHHAATWYYTDHLPYSHCNTTETMAPHLTKQWAKCQNIYLYTISWAQLFWNDSMLHDQVPPVMLTKHATMHRTLSIWLLWIKNTLSSHSQLSAHISSIFIQPWLHYHIVLYTLAGTCHIEPTYCCYWHPSMYTMNHTLRIWQQTPAFLYKSCNKSCSIWQ